MSEKRAVPIFRVGLAQAEDWLEGPVVAPDKSSYANHLSDVHHLFASHGAVLVYAGEWVLIPWHAVHQVRRGQRFFRLPWPLRAEGADQDLGEVAGAEMASSSKRLNTP